LLKAAIDLTTAGTNVKDAFNSLNGPMQRAYLELYGYASEGSKKRHNCGMLGELDRKVLPIYTPNAGVGSPRACVSIQQYTSLCCARPQVCRIHVLQGHF